MRILYIVQRYGTEVAGGAEALVEMFATRLVQRGHSVSVITSCARDYDTWSDHFDPGVTDVDGVRIRRLRVTITRDSARFSALSQRVLPGGIVGAGVTSDAWMAEQGPVLADFAPVLLEEARRHDVVVFMTYLYATTVLGMRELAGIAPMVVHPAAHEEWPLRLPIVRAALDHASAIACSTPEERDLVMRRFRPTVPVEVVGIGFDPSESVLDVAEFRRRYALCDAPYLVCVGRIDPNKGTDELIASFQEFRRRRPGSELRLVLCGAEMMDIADRDGLVVTGFVDEATRWAAIAGAELLVQPSYQESFGMTIAEAWMMERAVMVQQACQVTEGLVRRSGGGVAYRGFSSFDAALETLLDDPGARARMGRSGRRHLAEQYSWEAVMARYESLLERVVAVAQRIDLGSHTA